MTDLPQSLEAAITQAQVATQAALADGHTRLQVDLLFSELKPMPVAQQFLSTFTDLGSTLKVFFTDAGAAALAKRDWGSTPFQLRSLDVAGSRQTTSADEQVDPDDAVFVFVAPSSVEVPPVEQVCTAVGDRPVILLNARLEDVGTVGIGYAGRQLRDRFLKTFESCYYLRPLEGAALMRSYPSPWLVWQEVEGTYRLVAEEAQKPDSERLDEILAQISGNTAPAKKPGLLSGLQRFVQALRQ